MLSSTLGLICLHLCVISAAQAFSHLRMRRQADASALLSLPSNATSIRSSISDSFTCAERNYGYYADIDNDCQLFHVCLPVEFADGKKATYKWSFICPEETVFNQETFTCTREEDSISCADAPQYYSLNEKFGATDEPPAIEPVDNSIGQTPPTEET